MTGYYIPQPPVGMRQSDFPILGAPAFGGANLDGSLADAIVNGLSTLSKVGVAYWSGQTAVATQQALYDQAKAGSAAAQGAGAAAANVQQYIPYLIGGAALITLAVILTRK